jgi:hypothetical protein
MTNTLSMKMRLLMVVFALAVMLSGSIVISPPAHAIYNDFSYCDGPPKCHVQNP